MTVFECLAYLEGVLTVVLMYEDATRAEGDVSSGFSFRAGSPGLCYWLH